MRLNKRVNTVNVFNTKRKLVNVFKVIFLIWMLAVSVKLFAADIGLTPKTMQVIKQAAIEYGVSVTSLTRIAYIESRFKAQAMRVNKNGTVDYGMFQINSVHWTSTCKDLNIVAASGNARCAARILRKLQVRYANRDSNWMGRYHSGTMTKKLHYVSLLANVDLE